MNKINTFLILLLLLFTIKCEAWWPEVKGHSIGDYDNGFAGSYPYNTTDFYLCSERVYRVHYLGDENDTWSEEFSACQPAGRCRLIDGLAISGDHPYSCRLRDEWPDDFIFDYNIKNDTYGYCGELGISFASIIVYGNEYYRNSDTHNDYLCSYEQDVANRIIYNIFGKNLTYNYESETKIIKNEKLNVTVILLKANNTSAKGKHRIKIENSVIVKNTFKNLITEKYYGIISDIIGFDFNKIEKFFEKNLQYGMFNGDIAINFDWSEKIIIIEFGSKIHKNFYCHRGGFRINIYLNDNDFELLHKIKNLCKIFLRYFGKKISTEIRDLLSEFKGFENVEKIIDYINNNSNIIEEVILFTILGKILVL